MRELLFKNLTSNDCKKRDISVQEVIAKDGILATNERRCLYFVKNKAEISNPKDLAKLSGLNKENQDKHRCFYVMKVHDSRTGIDKLVCKVKGTFYAVVGKSVYCIVFIHSFKIRFEAIAVGSG